MTKPVGRRSLLAGSVLAAPVAFGRVAKAGPEGTTPTPTSERRVGVAYMLWHYSASLTGPDSDWKDVWGTPEIGFYESADRSVIKIHAGWLRDAGADFIFIDWSNNIDTDLRTGKGSAGLLYLERATGILLDEYTKMPKRPKVSIMLGLREDASAATDGRLQRKADQIFEEYISKPQFTPLFETYLGKPLLMVYVGTPSAFTTGLPPWSDPRFTVRFMTGFVSNQPPLLGPDRTSKYGFWSWEDRERPTVSIANGHPEAMTIVAAWRGTRTKPSPGRQGGKTFIEEWEFARSIGPRFALVTTFNVWRRGEGPTADISKDIEPSKEFGHLYLDIMSKQSLLFHAGK